MPCDDLPDDLKILWKEAGANPPMFSTDQLRKEIERMQARRRRGNLVLGVCMAFFVACFTMSFFFFPFNNTLTRIGSIVSVLVCGGWLVLILREGARVGSDPGDTPGVRFYRAELERARDSHRGLLWRFLLLPPPFILLDLGLAQALAKFSPFVAPLMWFDCALLLAAFVILVPMKQLRLARKYQSRIDALDATLRSTGELDKTKENLP